MRLSRRCSVLVAVGLAGCSSGQWQTPEPAHLPPPPTPEEQVPRTEPRARYGNPSFYEVYGQRYYVLDTATGYREQGLASWYGPKFHGKLTSSREPYDMYAYSAAHKTLPLPTWVRVTHLGNGRSIVLRINDRGPFVGDRIIDLSYAAAVALDVVESGTALVEVEALNPGKAAAPAPALPPTPDETTRSDGLIMQVGAFAAMANANRLVQQLERAGISAVYIEPTPDGSAQRVRIGPFASVSEYDALLPKLRRLGIRDVKLVTNVE
ncbi:MAG: septal ring lytic transglycosylase RlpA family protein [Pseudomonadota bacterium]